MLVEPFLYSSFRETQDTTLLAFLRTILENPRLAPLVTSFEGRDTRTFTCEKKLKFLENSDDDAQQRNQQDVEKIGDLLLLAIQQGEINDDGTFLWLEDILNGCWDATTALTMLCLPNLQKFQISVMNRSRMVTRVPYEGFEYDNVFDAMSYRWINRALRDAQELQSAGDTISKQSMRNLHTFKLDLSNSQHEQVWVSSIFGFLGLKSLKTFETDHVWLGENTDAYDVSVANLVIDNYRGFPGPWLYCPPNLTNFKNLTSFHFTAAEGQPFVFTELVSSIYHMAPSLHELVIRGSRNDEPAHNCRERSSLDKFVALERLDIAAPSLLRWLENIPDFNQTTDIQYARRTAPWDIAFPKRLRTLIVRECVLEIVFEAANLVNRRHEDCQRLGNLHLEFMHNFPRETTEKEVITLREQCVAADVKFTVDWNGS